MRSRSGGARRGIPMGAWSARRLAGMRSRGARRPGDHVTEPTTTPTREPVKRRVGLWALGTFGAADTSTAIVASATGAWHVAYPWIAGVTGFVVVLAGIVKWWPWLRGAVRLVDMLQQLPGRLDRIDERAEAKRRLIENVAGDVREIKADPRIDRLSADVRAIAERQAQHEQGLAWLVDAKPTIQKLVAKDTLGLLITGPVVVTPVERSAV